MAQYTKENIYEILAHESKLANQKLRRLEKSGLRSDAYGMALNYFDSQPDKVKRTENRFTSSKTLTFQQAQRELGAIRRFNRDKSSTPTGIKQTIVNRIAGTKAVFGRMSNTQVNALYDVINSGAYNRAMEVYSYGSDAIIDVLATEVRRRKNKLDVDDLIDVLDEWAEAGTGDLVDLERMLGVYRDIMF